MQKLLKDSSLVFLLDIKDHYDFNLYPTTSLDIGFIFQPVQDITIASLGCMSQELGRHQVIFRRLAPGTRAVLDTLLIDTVTVSKDLGFAYKNIRKRWC